MIRSNIAKQEGMGWDATYMEETDSNKSDWVPRLNPSGATVAALSTKSVVSKKCTTEQLGQTLFLSLGPTLSPNSLRQPLKL